MHPYLVRATGLEFDVEKRRGPKGLECLVMCDRWFAVLVDCELVFVFLVSADWRIDGAAEGIWVPLDKGAISLIYAAIAEGLFHSAIRDFGLGQHHQAACAYVEARNNSLTLGDTAGRHFDA